MSARGPPNIKIGDFTLTELMGPVSQAQLTGRAEFTRGCYNYSWH